MKYLGYYKQDVGLVRTLRFTQKRNRDEEKQRIKMKKSRE
jgi:hypothetical protein